MSSIVAEFLGGPRCGELEQHPADAQAVELHRPASRATDGTPIAFLRGTYLRSSAEPTKEGRVVFEWQGWR